MKNSKLKLADLKVESFVTSLELENKSTIKGGEWDSGRGMCQDDPTRLCYNTKDFLVCAFPAYTQTEFNQFCAPSEHGYSDCTRP